MTMTRQSVTSSAIRSIGHDPDTNTLEIEFSTGKRYRYVDINADVHQALITAPSIGHAFAAALAGAGGELVTDDDEGGV